MLHHSHLDLLLLFIEINIFQCNMIVLRFERYYALLKRTESVNFIYLFLPAFPICSTTNFYVICII